jgi:NhaP-type Na+/H+ or K+/H+ antiporter
VIGFGFEAFVFAYLGLSFFSYVDTVHWTYPWSWNFILLELVICIVARLAGTVGLLYCTSLCKHKRQVTFKQLLFICYAGLIRGAIAFGLVLKLDSSLVPDENNRRVIRTTALTLVVSTTIIFGSSMPMV